MTAVTATLSERRLNGPIILPEHPVRYAGVVPAGFQIVPSPGGDCDLKLTNDALDPTIYPDIGGKMSISATDGE
jgi:hypothetical protein